MPLIVTAARKLKRVLADEQNGVLDTLRRKEPVTSIDALVPALDAHAAVTSTRSPTNCSTRPRSRAPAEFGAKDTKTLRRTLDQAGALDTTRAFVRSDLVGPLRARLERAVADGCRRQRRHDQASSRRLSRMEDPAHRRPARRRVPIRVRRRAGRHRRAGSARWCGRSIPARRRAPTARTTRSPAPCPAGESSPPVTRRRRHIPGCRCLTLPAHQ